MTGLPEVTVVTRRGGCGKTHFREIRKTKLRQDALQTILSIFLDIFYPPKFRCFEENGLFQHPRLISPSIGKQ